MTEQVIENPDNLEFEEPTDNSNINIITPLNLDQLSNHDQTLLILNQDIRLPLHVFIKIWQNTKLHIAVDGGAQRLLQWCEDKKLDVGEYKPDYIIGDFDSIPQLVLTRYRELGVIVIHQETQYSTDLMKALSLCNLVLYYGFIKDDDIDEYDGISKLETQYKKDNQKKKKNKVFIIGGIGGRLDQTVHSISVLYKYRQSDDHLEIFYINKDFEDLIFIIPLGENFVRIRTDTLKQKRIVGLLPFGPEVMLETRGLKWDIMNWKSEIDTQISSSNHLVNRNGVYMKSDKDFILNMVLFDNDF